MAKSIKGIKRIVLPSKYTFLWCHCRASWEEAVYVYLWFCACRWLTGRCWQESIKIYQWGRARKFCFPMINQILLYISCCHTEKGKAVILCPLPWIVASLPGGTVGTGFGYAKQFVSWNLQISQKPRKPFASTARTPAEAQVDCFPSFSCGKVSVKGGEP